MSRLIAQVLTLLFVLATVALAWSAWSDLPERLPTHFDAAGNPDAWGSRTIFLLEPVLAVLFYLMLTIVERIPHKYNYLREPSPEHRERIYALSSGMVLALKFVVCATFFYLTWSTVRIAHGEANDLGIWFLPAFLVLMLAPVAIFVWRSRQIADSG